MKTKKRKNLPVRNTDGPANKTTMIAITIVFFITIVSSFGQILFKIGASKLSLDFQGIFMNYNLILGTTIYGLSGIAMIIALRQGELSVLYPIMSLNFVWVSLLSTRFLPIPETMSPMKWAGIIIIVCGVSLIGVGSRQNSSKIQLKHHNKSLNQQRANHHD